MDKERMAGSQDKLMLLNYVYLHLIQYNLFLHNTALRWSNKFHIYSEGAGWEFQSHTVFDLRVNDELRQVSKTCIEQKVPSVSRTDFDESRRAEGGLDPKRDKKHQART